MKSPGGSLFPYYYKGGELHCLKYGSFFSNADALFALMKAEEEFISSRNRQLNIWVDFYETQLTDSVLIKFVENINCLQNHTKKLAIVGFTFWDKWRLRQKIKKTTVPFSMPIKYFDDPEVAKTWLVSE
ncbi:hypothetical protein [Paenibacillus dendrobii]|nr:hypothetical protein [Paenibacillus dendrobii]